MGRKTIIDQFSYRGEAGEIWRGFDAFLDTEAYLNLGYSEERQSHAIGKPQYRLVAQVADALRELGVVPDDRLLDVGCGRGGPITVLVDQLGVEGIGVDIVPFNLKLARKHSAKASHPSYVLASATELPFGPDSMESFAAIDSLVYIDRIDQVFSELARVLKPGGIGVITDLTVADEADPMADELVEFANAWGFPALRRVGRLEATIDQSNFECTSQTDLTNNSIGQFRRWTTRYRRLRQSPTGFILNAFANRLDLRLEAIDRQVETAHAVLPSLRHTMLCIERQDI